MKRMNHTFRRSLAAVLLGTLLLLSGSLPTLAMGDTTARDATSGATPCALPDDVTVSTRLGELLFGKRREDTQQNEPSSGERMLCPGGEIFGLKLRLGEVTVTDVDPSADGACDLLVGDRLLSIDGRPITSAEEVTEAVRSSNGHLLVTVLRDGQTKQLRITPDGTDGNYRLGITVRDGTAGIGTVTFVDPTTGSFGGLGHGICDGDTGELLPMREGIVTEVTLGGVKRGEVGKPGELRGVLKRTVIGSLSGNDDCGVFGTLKTIAKKQALPVASRTDVHEGRATILCTVHGNEVDSYEVTIRDIDYQSEGTKSFTVKITDPSLLAMTGGIVRGMSGSPIIQDGKLVGAVTHVMVADPTEGYGIFIENMLNASESARNELPAA